MHDDASNRSSLLQAKLRQGWCTLPGWILALRFTSLMPTLPAVQSYLRVYPLGHQKSPLILPRNSDSIHSDGQ